MEAAERGDLGLRLAQEGHFDLLIIDRILPDMDGLAVCRELRARSTVPIIVVSARGEEVDRVLGLELGADDYVVKPFEVRELVARVGAHLRRSDVAPTDQLKERFEFPGLTIDLRRRQVYRDGEEVQLTLTEFNLLALLASRPGQVMSRAELLRRVWGYEVEIETSQRSAIESSKLAAGRMVSTVFRRLSPRPTAPPTSTRSPGSATASPAKTEPQGGA